MVSICFSWASVMWPVWVRKAFKGSRAFRLRSRVETTRPPSKKITATSEPAESLSTPDFCCTAISCKISGRLKSSRFPWSAILRSSRLGLGARGPRRAADRARDPRDLVGRLRVVARHRDPVGQREEKGERDPLRPSRRGHGQHVRRGDHGSVRDHEHRRGHHDEDRDEPAQGGAPQHLPGARREKRGGRLPEGPPLRGAAATPREQEPGELDRLQVLHRTEACFTEGALLLPEHTAPADDPLAIRAMERGERPPHQVTQPGEAEVERDQEEEREGRWRRESSQEREPAIALDGREAALGRGPPRQIPERLDVGHGLHDRAVELRRADPAHVADAVERERGGQRLLSIRFGEEELLSVGLREIEVGLGGLGPHLDGGLVRGAGMVEVLAGEVHVPEVHERPDRVRPEPVRAYELALRRIEVPLPAGEGPEREGIERLLGIPHLERREGARGFGVDAGTERTIHEEARLLEARWPCPRRHGAQEGRDAEHRDQEHQDQESLAPAHAEGHEPRVDGGRGNGTQSPEKGSERDEARTETREEALRAPDELENDVHEMRQMTKRDAHDREEKADRPHDEETGQDVGEQVALPGVVRPTILSASPSSPNARDGFPKV